MCGSRTNHGKRSHGGCVSHVSVGQEKCLSYFGPKTLLFQQYKNVGTRDAYLVHLRRGQGQTACTPPLPHRCAASRT